MRPRSDLAALAFTLITGGVAAAQPASSSDPRQQAAALCDRADALYRQREQRDAAAEPAAACERAARAISAHDIISRALYIRGNVELIVHNQVVDSQALFKEAQVEAERAGNKRLLARAYFRLADVASDATDWAAMMEYSRRALEASPTPLGRVAFLSNSGRAHMELHERDAALRDYIEGLDLAHQINDEQWVAIFQSELGLLYWRFDRDREKTLAYYEAALTYDRREHHNQAIRNDLNNMGNLFRRPGTYAQAERMYVEGLELARRDGALDPFLMKNEGIVLRETGRRDQAERMLLDAVAAADSRNIGRIRWQARMELGTLYRVTDPARAERYFEECLDVLEAQHTNVLLEQFSAGALSGAITIYDDPYDLYIDELMRTNQPAKALLVAERARARSFLDSLAAARQAIADRLPPEFVRDERALLQRISQQQAQMRNAGDLPRDQREALAAAIRADEERLTAMRVRLTTEHPEIAHARYPHLVTLEEIQKRLVSADEALLEYFIGAEASTVWIVRHDRVAVVRLPKREEVEAAVRKYVAALSAPGTDYETPGREVASLLLRDALPSVGDVRRLILIPHGVLNYVPFEALPDANGKLLIESYAVSYAPSASSLAFLRSRPAPPPGDVIAIGNPVLRAAGANSERAAEIDRVGLLQPLPYTARELQAIRAAFAGGTVILEQGHATETELAGAALGHAAVVHFATHGLIDEEVPQRSGLALTMAPPKSDGILQVREIYQLRMNAALVTLSACRTALGKNITGEGMVGFTRAFFYAGARSVMASLWNVNDAAAVDFMTRFYAGLRQGQSIDEAARTAKLAILAAGPELRHPYYWAGFIVSGDARTTVHVTMFPGRLFVLAALALGLLASAGLYVVERRRPVYVAQGFSPASRSRSQP